MWSDNTIQFARLLAEIEYTGALSDRGIADLCDAMDLEKDDLLSLFDRAREQHESHLETLRQARR